MRPLYPPRRYTPQQPESVDFIDNRLPALHPAFEKLPHQVQYDGRSGVFVQDPEPASIISQPVHQRQVLHKSGQSKLLRRRATLGKDDGQSNKTGNRQIPARALPPGTQAMRFWGRIFRQAMDKHLEYNPVEPDKLIENPEFSIRSQDTWESIYERLQKARVERFDSSKSDFRGRFKASYRKTMGSADVPYLDTIFQLIPDNDMVSPVKAVLDVVLEAAKSSSFVREKVNGASACDSLEETFAKIEVFFTIFPGDKNIVNASIELLSRIFHATEKTMVFYLSPAAKRFFKALAQGPGYEEDLVNSIDEVQKAVDKLIEEAKISDMEATREGMENILQGIDDLALLEINHRGRTEVVLANTQNIIRHNEQIMLLMEESDAKILSHLRQSEAATKQQFDDLCLQLANYARQLFQDGRETRLQYMKVIERMEDRVDKLTEAQRNFEERFPGLDFHGKTGLVSGAPVVQQITYFSAPPSPQLIQHVTRQKVRTPPSQHQGFVYYAHENRQQQQQPLYTPNQYTHQPQDPFYFHPQQPMEQTSIPILSLLDTPLFPSQLGLYLSMTDMSNILSSTHSIPLRARSRAKQVLLTWQFQAWARSGTSRELLIRGSPGAEPRDAKGAMEVVCASLVLGLTRGGDNGEVGRFISLVWFCGRHAESHHRPFSGARFMIRSFIRQLLEQLPDNTGLVYGEDLPEGVDFGMLQQWDPDGCREGEDDIEIGCLCALLAMLLSKLGSDKTVICVMDAIESYERPRYERDMLVVLDWLLGVARDEHLGPAVKLLVTSPVGTVGVHEMFRMGDDGGNVLFLDSLGAMGDEFGLVDVQETIFRR